MKCSFAFKIVVSGLAALLLAVAPAAGQAPPAGNPHDITSYGLVYEVPGMAEITPKNVQYKTANGAALTMDVYSPRSAAGGARPPLVVFVNGVGDRPPNRLREWGQYRSWGQLMAASGYVAVTFDALAPAEDIRDVFAYLRANADALGFDSQRVGVWACSANMRVAFPYVMEAAGPEVKCAVMYYGLAEATKLRPDLPVLFVRAGLDRKALNDQLDRLVARGTAENMPWTAINAANLHHAFDCIDDNDESRRVVRQTVKYFDHHLKPAPAAPPPSPARQALAHWFSQEWEQAAAAYQRYLERYPEDGVAHMRLGLSLVQLKRFPEAIASLERAQKYGQPAGVSLYNIACAYALAGEKDRALGYLEKAVEAGYRDRQHITNDPDLEGLRGEARFKALLDRLN